MNNKTGLEEKDLKKVCELHGGACQATVNLFLLKDGKVASQLINSERLVINPGGNETKK